ncbi:MAG TPA: hypothetical protein VFT22_10340 [Kofleriaceae bacterium]|nr:hypothetical protein [Kofleriaceae bacterium]
MVSRLHEGLIELVREQPGLLADVLARLSVQLPRLATPRVAESTLNETLPVEHSADAVVLFGDPRPVLGVVVEAQLRRHDRKRFTWPLYVVAARARHECPFLLVVLTPKASTARWAAQPIEIGGGMVHRPCVIGPDRVPQITDVAQAMREPRLAVLSLLVHGRGDPHTAARIATAAAAAVEQLPEDQRLVYSGLIETALSQAARKEVMMLPTWHKFLSTSQRQALAQGVAQGRVEGRVEGRAEGATTALADALKLVLKERNLVVTRAQQRRIDSCRDAAKLRRWLARAVSARSVDALLSGR